MEEMAGGAVRPRETHKPQGSAPGGAGLHGGLVVGEDIGGGGVTAASPAVEDHPARVIRSRQSQSWILTLTRGFHLPPAGYGSDHVAATWDEINQTSSLALMMQLGTVTDQTLTLATEANEGDPEVTEGTDQEEQEGAQREAQRVRRPNKRYSGLDWV
jgi:hypothetical protein